MKINKDIQSAINEMAKQLYLIKIANKAKADELDKFIASVDKNESAFKEGIPFEFTLETADSKSKKACGKLKLRNQRNWELADIDTIKEA